MKNVVITGATSMIGVALVKSCIENNINCLCLIRKNSSNICRLPTSPLVKSVECNLEDIALFSHEYVQNQYDVFFHLGWGGTSKSQRNDPDMQCQNIVQTLDAVHLAKKFKCQTFIGIGSQAEYGRVSGPISPSTPANAELAYGVAKHCAGKLSAVLCEQLDIRHVWGRVFSVYGMWDNEGTLIRTLIEQISNGIAPKLTKSEQLWDYLFVDDAGEAIRLIGEKGHDKTTYNIGSGSAIPLKNYVEIVNREINPNIIPKYGAIPYAEKQVMHLCADIESLTNDTGFVPQTTFEQGIQKTIKWWSDNRLSK